MKVQIKKWGNSFGLRITKALAKEMQIQNNRTVNLTSEDNHLLISPVEQLETYDLSVLLSQISEFNLHEPVDFEITMGT